MIVVSLARDEDINVAGIAYCQAFNIAEKGEHWTFTSANAFLLYCYRRQPDLFYLAKEQSNILGGIYGEIKPWWDGNHLANVELFVAPDFQKHRIGSRLLLTIIAGALDKYQISAIEGIAFRHPNFPLQWYERLGFKIMKHIIPIIGDPKIILTNLQSGPFRQKKKVR